ncbi:hypothetical protein HK405_001218 [Cladochytrium tenue]|nr:hypothetical protein HK405_001218 [Cladochytrium tenue]
MSTPQRTSEPRKTLFVTGAAGYVGSAITALAVAEGYVVRGLSRSEKSDATITQLGGVPVRGDLASLDVLRREAATADAVISLAAPAGHDLAAVRTDEAAVAAMVQGLRDGAGDGHAGLLIATSGSLVVAPDPAGGATDEESPLWDDPINQRVACELNALRLGRESGVPVVVVRLAPFVYGRGASGVRLFMQGAAQDGRVWYVGAGDERTSTVHVEDAARLYSLLLAAARPDKLAGQVFNCTSGDYPTFRDLMAAMGEALGLPVVSLAFEEAAAACAAAMAPMFPGNPDGAATLGGLMARFRSAANVASNQKATRELGWEPKEKGILEDIRHGSYVHVAAELRKTLAL